MSGERSAAARARRAIRKLADPAPRLFADLAASERLAALGLELPLLDADPFGSLSLAAGAGRPRTRRTGGARSPAVAPAAGRRRRRRRRPPPARVPAAPERASAPASGEGAAGARAGAPAPGAGQTERAADLPAPPGTPGAAPHGAPVFPLGRIPAGAAPVAPAAGAAGGGGSSSFAGGAAPGRRPSESDAAEALPAPTALELTGGEAGAGAEPTFELLDRLARSILERSRREDERDSTAPSRTPGPRRARAGLEAVALGAEPAGAVVTAPAGDLAAAPGYPTPPAAGPAAAAEAAAGAPPGPPDALGAPAPPPAHAAPLHTPGAAVGAPATGGALAPDDLAAAVNDALVDQARRHGVDLA